MKTSDLTMRRPKQSTIASKLYYKQEGAKRRIDTYIYLSRGLLS